METESKTKNPEGACQCQAVRFTVTLPSKSCVHCHCDNCRRTHGAAFVTFIGFQKEQVHITAGDDQLGRYVSDTGTTRSFCTHCGSTLFCEGPREPGEIHVVYANLIDSIDVLPEAHVYVDDHAPWWTITDSLPQYGGESGMEPK